MKKLSLLVIGSCVCWLSAYTQTDKWAVGVLGVYDNYILKTRNNFGFNHEYASKGSFTSGINIKYNLKENIFI